ncbi:transglycosylase SLT domain-containing protein [Massilia agilis]|uniref:Transglycosylase SLT domain-containing protein n=1 Tax=Massilia agilis TaxID=1811226 RepID=A0ABT2DAL0_9BURK|nr:transglycosylase SLT domain-containing protein [Massilia agilis]MCS0808350.1 transglycosylase SLT domain-containing protein [Massilia agilis]
MINRFIGQGARLFQNAASQPITVGSVFKAARGLLTTAQHTLTVFGLSAVAVLAVLYTRPDLAKRVSELLYPQPAVVQAPVHPLAAMVDPHHNEAVEAPAADEKPAVHSKQQQFVTSWLSRRYRVAGDAANMLVATTYQTAHEIKIDPLLVLAVMAIESGLNPFAESPMGAKGLMQVMAKVHNDKFEEVGGAQAALNPVANIRVGAQILKDYVNRTGSVEAALKTYVGAGAADSDSGYGNKVLAEYKRLKQVATGKNVPISFPAQPTAVAEKAAPRKQPATPVEQPAAQETLAGL